MSYAHLPLEERIQKAAGYALLLTPEEEAGADILSLLQQEFDLTPEQAQKACELMHKQHRQGIRQIAKRKLRETTGAALLFLLATLVLLAIGSNGLWGFLLSAALFGAAFTGSLFVILHWYHRMRSPEQYGTTATLKSGKYQVSVKEALFNELRILPVFLLFIMLGSYYYWKEDHFKINEDDYFTVQNLVLDRPVEKQRTSGRGRKFDYYFHFQNLPHRFILKHDFVYYGDWSFSVSVFSTGDTVDVQVKKTGQEEMNSASAKKNQLVNIRKNERWLVDHEKRNQKETAARQKMFQLMTWAFFASLAITLVWTFFRIHKKAGL